VLIDEHPDPPPPSFLQLTVGGIVELGGGSDDGRVACFGLPSRAFCEGNADVLRVVACSGPALVTEFADVASGPLKKLLAEPVKVGAADGKV